MRRRFDQHPWRATQSQRPPDDPTEVFLKEVARSVRRDRRRLLELLGKAQGMDRKTRRRIHDELRRALKRLRRATDRIRESRSALVIRGARLAPPQPLLPPAPGGPRALPTTRRPATPSGPPREIRSLARASERNTERGYRAIQENSRAIDTLAREQRRLQTIQRRLVRLVGDLAVRGDAALLEGLLVGQQSPPQRGRTLVAGPPRSKRGSRPIRGGVDRTLESVRKRLGVLAEPQTAQALNSAATTIQVAAFGTARNPLDKNNLLIAANHIVWGTAFEWPRKLGLKGAARQGDWILPLAGPLAALAGSSALLGSPTQERFVTGVASDFTVESGRRVARVSLESYVATSAWKSFKARTDVPVILTWQTAPAPAPAPAPVPSPVPLLAGQVIAGELTIFVSNTLSAPPVSWMVDLQEPAK